MGVVTVTDSRRGCGWRKAGGLYLMGGYIIKPCGVLPIPLGVCPFCNCGIKQSRGWTWVLKEVLGKLECREPGCKSLCEPFDGSVDEFGLLWVGEKFYSTPGDFLREGVAQGISKRIAAVPKNFVLGETWVLLAHPKAEARIGSAGSVEYFPGVFSAFKPNRIEYVCRGDESDEEIEALEKRGITPVNVQRDYEQQQMEL